MAQDSDWRLKAKCKITGTALWQKERERVMNWWAPQLSIINLLEDRLLHLIFQPGQQGFTGCFIFILTAQTLTLVAILKLLQRLSGMNLVWLSKPNAEGGSQPEAMDFTNKNVKAIHGKCNRTTGYRGIKCTHLKIRHPFNYSADCSYSLIKHVLHLWHTQYYTWWNVRKNNLTAKNRLKKIQKASTDDSPSECKLVCLATLPTNVSVGITNRADAQC